MIYCIYKAVLIVAITTHKEGIRCIIMKTGGLLENTKADSNWCEQSLRIIANDPPYNYIRRIITCNIRIEIII